MKKISVFVFTLLFATNVFAYQKVSSREFGTGDARNQNVVVKCTTPTGQVSNETCSLRRYVKCGDNNKCSGWQQWRDLRNTRDTYSDWQSGATACCRAKGLR